MAGIAICIFGHAIFSQRDRCDGDTVLGLVIFAIGIAVAFWGY